MTMYMVLQEGGGRPNVVATTSIVTHGEHSVYFHLNEFPPASTRHLGSHRTQCCPAHQMSPGLPAEERFLS